MKPFYVALVHGPVLNRDGQEVTTAVTNLDIHDISRTARTYGAKGYFIVTPVAPQREIVSRILEHWRTPQAKSWHPDRVEALSLVRLVASFEDAVQAIADESGVSGLKSGERPEVVYTDARAKQGAVSYPELRKRWEADGDDSRPALIVLGTGWGLSERFLGEVDTVLAPVWGPSTDYNHLSVRAAACAILDRLFGK